MQRGWEAPSCYGNGLGLSKMVALSAWMPGCPAAWQVGVGEGRHQRLEEKFHNPHLFSLPPPEVQQSLG